MKTNMICWLPESFYTNEDCKRLLIDNQIVPLLDSSYSVAIWEAEGKPETMRYIDFGAESGLKPYWDEPISTKEIGVLNPKGFTLVDAIVGETSTETIQQLVDAGCKSITFTCYSWHLFRIFGLNIRMPFTTQLRTWEKLEEMYGKQTETTYNMYKPTITWEVRESKFFFCWIMLDQTKSFKKLIGWCITHNKTIGLIAPDNWKENPEKVYEGLKQFIKAYNESK